jgi:D-amino peptidase
MKIYISADIEGIAGISHWDEAKKAHATYQEFRAEMTEEVVAACEGAIGAGATQILIKDAHDTGRNIIAGRLPDCAKLIRGWSGHPLAMVQELDESFAALVLIGYHSKAGSQDNPLAHTLTLAIAGLRLNGELCSEFRLHSYAAALYGVPVVFISGDKGICAEAAELIPSIKPVAASEGRGSSTISIPPALAQRLIREGVGASLKGDLSRFRIKLPENFVLEVTFTNPTDAYAKAWYPGARQSGPQTVRFESKDYFEVLRAIRFIM